MEFLFRAASQAKKTMEKHCVLSLYSCKESCLTFKWFGLMPSNTKFVLPCLETKTQYRLRQENLLKLFLTELIGFTGQSIFRQKVIAKSYDLVVWNTLTLVV